MIKKFFHCICVLVSGILWSLLLAFVVQQLFFLVYHVNLLNADTYKGFSSYWNSNKALKGIHFLMLFSLLLYFPICLYGWFKLSHYKFMRLITVPLNKIVNVGFNNYQAPNINIKNLKIEEKKDIEQLVKERLEKENKKNQGQKQGATDFRKKIIEQIEEKKK